MQSQPKLQFPDQSYDWKTLTLWDFLHAGHYPRSWSEFFLRYDVQKDLYNISLAIDSDAKEGFTIYPPINKVFRAFLPLDKIKVVVLGMDPYHNGSAVGYCFSVLPGNDINPSLRSIYKELKNEGYERKVDGVLTHWADQGCVMLNTALTVIKREAGSHTHVWYKFSKKVIQYIVENTQNVAWLLMGKDALDFLPLITGDHHPIVTSHPMPLAAGRKLRGYDAFWGSNAFRRINDYLEQNGKKPIDW